MVAGDLIDTYRDHAHISAVKIYFRPVRIVKVYLVALDLLVGLFVFLT